MGAERRPQETAGLLHDLANLVAAARRLAESATRRLDPGHPAYADVAALGAACREGAEMVREVVEGAAPGGGGVSDLSTVAPDRVDLVRRTHGSAVRLVPAAGPLRVPLAPGQARRVLDNLLLNAVEAVNGNGGEIVVSLAATPGGQAQLEVRDAGRGMTARTASRAFEPGFTTRENGRGLGLSVVRDLVEKSGGEVSVESAEGRGTSVRVVLPLLPAATRGSGTILLVDDQPTVRSSVRDVLRESGYRVLEAGDAEGALRLLDGVDLLLTDLKLPDMDGADLAATAAAAHPGLKVAFMSGYAWPRDPGAELLVKPTDPEELRVRIGALLAGATRP